MKIISVVGPTQSGSTLLFNLIRFILQNFYVIDSCWVESFKKGEYDKNCEYLIVKAHGYDQELKNKSDLIFLPIRDFRDSAISHAKRFGNNSDVYKKNNNKFNVKFYMKNIKDNIELFSKWKEYSNYIFNYEEYTKNNKKIIDEICHKFSLNLNQDQIDTVLKKSVELHKSKNIVKVDDPNNILYKKTLISQSHNSSGGKINKYKKYFHNKINKLFLNDNKIKAFFKSNKYL
ncbi:MAG: hypothetical protein CMF62_03800 [Magnetococcales bacterium]|nr:hypothetical protein [Magnetococcales bacterium]